MAIGNNECSEISITRCKKKDNEKGKEVKKIYDYLLRVFCFEYKICSIDYFLDKMQSYEVDILIEKLPYTDRPNVEMLRFNGFITAQVNSKKRLKPSDILKLPYEVAEEEKEEREYQEKKLLYSEQGDKITTKAEADRLYKEFIQKYQVDGNK